MGDQLVPAFAGDEFQRVLCVVAHPDDVEYGTSSAVAAWTARGVEVVYLLLTRGEAGMDSSPPERTAELRHREQVAGAQAVGVTRVDVTGEPLERGIASLEAHEQYLAGIPGHPPPRLMLTGITMMQGQSMGARNAVLFRAWDFQAPPPIALEAMRLAQAGQDS